MRTYQEVFRTPEFTPFFLSGALSVAASTVSGLALGTLVHSATGSPLLSALAMFGPSLAQVVGAATLLSAADRLRPRGAMTGLALSFAVAAAVQAVPGFPLWALFTVLAAQGLISSAGGGIRFGLLNEILTKDGYLLGRSVLNMAVGTLQIVGYALGGVLVTLLTARGALLVGALLYVAAATVTRLGLTDRPPRATGRPSIAATWRVNARLWASVPRRYVYLALWVPNGLIAGCESLYLSYDPEHAGALFACAALGMLAGDTLVGRFLPPWWRERLGAPLRLVLAAPYLMFILEPGLPVALVAVTLASVGFAASLLLQERLMRLTPDELSGQALGLHSSGLLTLQGVGALLAGTAAELTSPATAMTAMAAVSVAVTLVLAPGLRVLPKDVDGTEEEVRQDRKPDRSAHLGAGSSAAE
ncbi:MFS transporter [Streptomyces sp. NBC_00102]|uniref:MFS transporter n=1 Tax=Streptomyces sp. NBC_00102 TaxID=2975652 RepID=UPI002253B4FF|nr:MFS transporter [Streptomyces sp. NBC_00102]MCX5400862.1 MFS transporter [Streptomyces sp. NBC_00102]